MLGTLKGRADGRLARLTVGVTDVLPKFVAYQLIEPALKLEQSYRIVCREGTNEELLPALALHEIDVVLSDAPIAPSLNVKAFNHLLGECDMTLFASAKLAKVYRRNFPRPQRRAISLADPEHDGAKFIGSVVRKPEYSSANPR